MTRHFLVTGGAGFIGCNYVYRLLRRSDRVTIFDNLSRDGARSNLRWLQDSFGVDSFRLVQGDVRDGELLRECAADVDVVVHLAGQVAVTTSVADPREDFEINALGTFNVLEAARCAPRPPIFLYASTNKVYGGMESVRVVEGATRYHYADFPNGISEEHGLDFHSPYGCSKGCGDQYVRDYARIYGLRTLVMRQSCIYGPRQFGVEDQGWVAWFVIAAVTNKPITIYGDGKQVRDVLFIEDLLDAYDAALNKIEQTAGQVYNLGGGASNILAIWSEFGPLLEKLTGRPVAVSRGDWRPGDQKVFVSDVQKAKKELGWSPKVGVEEGIRKLYEWVNQNRSIFQV